MEKIQENNSLFYPKIQRVADISQDPNFHYTTFW